MAAGRGQARDKDAGEDLGDRVATLAYAVERGREALLKPHGVTPMEFNLLRALQGKERTATDLVGALPVDASRISRLVAGLADKGLLRRRRMRNDRRTVKLRLTERGEALTDDLRERVRAHEERLVEGLNPAEARAFYSASGRMLANYAALRAGG